MNTNDQSWEIYHVRIFNHELSPEEMTRVMKELEEPPYQETLDTYAPMLIAFLAVNILLSGLMIWIIATTVKEWK